MSSYRRTFLFQMAAAASLGLIMRASESSAQTSAAGKFDQLLAAIQNSPDEVEKSRGLREFAQNFPATKEEKAPLLNVPPSPTPISDRAISMLIACEISSEAVYTSRYQCPVWPKGDSGITVGIGYDIGYTTPAEMEEDWKEFISKSSIERLGLACGKTGTKAQPFVKDLQTIKIPWSAAYAQFNQQTKPRYVGLSESSLPNFDSLGPDSRGALVSLVYNRGPSFRVPLARDPTNRYQEMRLIYELMVQQQFKAIPQQIRSMKRLWLDQPDMAGVVARRELEAELFEIGLIKPA